MNPTHNSECPVCHDRWRFNPRYATLNEQEKQRLVVNGKLLVVCEDCMFITDVTSEQAVEWSFVY